MTDAPYSLALHLEDEISLDVTVENDIVRARTLTPSRELRHKLAFYVGDTVVRISERVVALSQLLAKDENDTDLRFIASSLLRPETRETLENMAFELHVVPRIRVVTASAYDLPAARITKLTRGAFVSLVLVDANERVLDTLYTGHILTVFPSTAPQ